MTADSRDTILNGTRADGTFLEVPVDAVENLAGGAVDWLKGLGGDALGAAGDAAKDALGAGMDFAGDALTGEFMKQYGYAGALTFLYMTLFNGSGWKTAGLVAGVVGFLFGKFANPLLGKIFNSASGADDPAQNPNVTLETMMERDGEDGVAQGRTAEQIYLGAQQTNLRVGQPPEDDHDYVNE